MRAYLFSLDFVLWGIGFLLVALISWQARIKFRILSILMAFVTLESIALAGALRLSPQIYSRIYYKLAVPEFLLMGLTAVEIAAALMPSWKQRVWRWGPITFTAPLFFTVVTVSVLVTMQIIQLTELALALSAALLFASFCFQELAASKLAARIAWVYTGLLVMLIGCAEWQSHSGFTPYTRRAWPIAWILGTGALAFCFERKEEF